MTAGSVIREQNRVPIWWGISSVDGESLVPIQIDEATGAMLIEMGMSVMPVMANLPESIPRDENRIPCLAGSPDGGNAVFIPVSVNPTNGAVQAQVA